MNTNRKNHILMGTELGKHYARAKSVFCNANLRFDWHCLIPIQRFVPGISKRLKHSFSKLCDPENKCKFGMPGSRNQISSDLSH